MPPALRETTLGNGLQVIVREVRTAPVTSSWMWYRVGSRNEAEGHTGLAHWVEHMMFKGSPRFGKGSIMRSVDRLGGYVNAMTSNDFTAYLMTLPSERAELALEIESDRMVGALFDPDEVEAERTVILAEREASENLPRFNTETEVPAPVPEREYGFSSSRSGSQTMMNCPGSASSEQSRYNVRILALSRIFSVTVTLLGRLSMGSPDQLL